MEKSKEIVATVETWYARALEFATGKPADEFALSEQERKELTEAIDGAIKEYAKELKEQTTEELPEDVREGIKKSLVPEASEAFYKWYKTDEKHRAVLTLTIDEERGMIGGEVLGHEQTLIAGFATHIERNTQILNLMNKAMLACAIGALDDLHELSKSLIKKEDSHGSAAE